MNTKLLSACFIALFSISAFAIDTDGDGVDDSIDAFPNNKEAATDTDADGKPDSINIVYLTNIFADSFESGNFTAGGWTLGGTMSGTPWTIYNYGGTNGKVAKLTQTTACGFFGGSSCGAIVYMQKTVTVPAEGGAVRFYIKGFVGFDYGPGKFFIDSTLMQQWDNLGGTTWTAGNFTIPVGTHVLKWQTEGGGATGGYMYVDAVNVYVPSTLIEDTDDDNDGVSDTADKFPLDPAESADNDNDGIGNNADPDDDNDTILDASDNCPFVTNTNQLNNDGDAPGDACDGDDDNDGVLDTSDKFPFNAAASVDGDNDGAPTSWNASCDTTCQLASGLTLDNCPSNANANQLNTDGDSKGDVCDTDDDNDGVLDTADKFPLDPTESIDTDLDGIGNNADTDDDNDGMPDIWEIANGLNSLLNDANGDADGDGYTNLQEYLNGTNPQDPLSHPVISVKNDYTNSKIAGFYWKGDSNGVETQNQIWQLTFPLYSANYAVPTRFYPPQFTDQANWEIQTTGDFNKDGDADVLWRNKTTAQWKVWQMQNGTRAAQNTLADFDIDHAWQVIGAGDTDKDGDDDIILNSSSTGYVMIWEMQNHAIINTHNIGAKPGFVLTRIGDFNNDGDVDLLFREIGTDVLSIWEIEQNAFVSELTFPSTGTGYNPVCAGDFDNDGDADILLLNSTDNQEKWFVIQNYTRTQTFGSPNIGFRFISCGDYDGDGDMDTLWQRTSDDANRVVLQQNYGATKQTVYTNTFGGTDPANAGYGYLYRGNSN